MKFFNHETYFKASFFTEKTNVKLNSNSENVIRDSESDAESTHGCYNSEPEYFIEEIKKIKEKIQVFLKKYKYSWSNGIVVKVLDSQSRGPVFKTTGWLQGQLSLSSF